ncbi:hypothetical protein, partial [Actinomyces massiliensis]|uniref:hypothetical protein n=1 Tax=Actinomyces massiliensis TaxID=461393 RepID=UPI001E421A0C
PQRRAHPDLRTSIDPAYNTLKHEEPVNWNACPRSFYAIVSPLLFMYSRGWLTFGCVVGVLRVLHGMLAGEM